MPGTEKIEVQNVNVPGRTSKVNAAKYLAMKKSLLNVLPISSPGLTQKEMISQVKEHLPEDLFPGGATSGWWVKTVQLDLESKGQVVREATKPLKWYKSDN